MVGSMAKGEGASFMSARDIYHEHVRDALDKDGWRITRDPLHLQWGAKDMYVDLAAEELVAAEKQGRKIAVEIKSFIGASELEDLKNAIGQFVIYRNVLARIEPERELYLAVRQATYEELFTEPIGTLLMENEGIRLLIFDPQQRRVVQWIS
jgi:XisH protein